MAMILRLLGRAALALLVAALLFFFSDWALWRLKLARGTALGSVTVSRVVVAPLKGGREEYFQDGTRQEPCSRSAIGQGGMRACWWVERHRLVWDR